MDQDLSLYENIEKCVWKNDASYVSKLRLSPNLSEFPRRIRHVIANERFDYGEII